MPRELLDLFEKANEALFNLHRAMEVCLKDLPGKENWRDVYRMRIELSTVKVICGNNFKPIPADSGQTQA